LITYNLFGGDTVGKNKTIGFISVVLT